jgi:hypothetical protein
VKMRTSSAFVALAATLVAAGCSSGEDSDHSSEPSSSATSDTSSTTAVADATAPTVKELTDSLALVVAPDVDAATKAADIENGQARLANLEQMTAALANYGAITFEVQEPTVEGETATALVAIATPRGTAAPTPNTWVLIDGHWKVSETSACQLLAMGQAPCV